MQALNDREMPTAGSMLEAFNQQLVVRCGEDHAAALASLHLPTDAVQTSPLFHPTVIINRLVMSPLTFSGVSCGGNVQQAVSEKSFLPPATKRLDR